MTEKEYSMGKAIKMLINVPDLIRNPFAQLVRQKFFQIKTVIFVMCLNYCLKTCLVCAGPSIQQEQELLLLEALSKRQPSYYGTSNSLMDILGQSMFFSAPNVFVFICICVFFFIFSNFPQNEYNCCDRSHLWSNA